MEKVIDNFSIKMTFAGKYLRLGACALLFFGVGMQSAKAQTQATPQGQSTLAGAVNKIPEASVSVKHYTVNKAVNSKISFDATTPNFFALTIVDSNNNPLPSVIATTDGMCVANSTKIIFDFAHVPAGTFYAKYGQLNTSIYYKIEVE